MMGKKRNYNSGPDKNVQANAALDSKIPRLVEKMLAHLENGRIVEAAKLFLAGQTSGIFPPEHTLAKKLVQTIGAKATNRIIVAFAPARSAKRDGRNAGTAKDMDTSATR
jgi:hypothetical protein